MTTDAVETKNPHAELEKPSISEVLVKLTDRLRLQLHQERALRTRVQLDLAQAAFKEAQDQLRGVETGIATEYNLSPKDSIDIDTGKIVRGK
jgi:hypothetical protein